MIRFFTLFWMLFACSSSAEKTDTIEGPPDVPTEQEPEEPVVELEDPPAVETDLVGEGELEPEEQPVHRNKKRMNIEQVRASMKKISGGVEWKSGNQQLWDKYSSTLGVPDYQQLVVEDLSPSVLFQKFLDDAAVYTCEQWMSAEMSGQSAYFFQEIEADETDPSLILGQIASLRRQIHGQKRDTTEPIVSSFFELHRQVMQRTGDPISAWKTVCVGFFTHPDFFTY